MNECVWWKIKFYENNANFRDDHYSHFYLTAINIQQITDCLLSVDGNLFYYPHKIESVAKTTYFSKLFEEILDLYFRYEFNDSETWERLKAFFPDVTCDSSVNTPEVIDRNCIRFSYNDQLYEYSSAGVSMVFLENVM